MMGSAHGLSDIEYTRIPHSGGRMTPMLTMPSRPLIAKPGEKPLRYTNKDNTDIRKTFEKARRVLAQQHAPKQ